MINKLTKNPPTIVIDSPEQPYVPAVAPTPPYPGGYGPPYTVWVFQQVLMIIPGGIDGMGNYRPPSVAPNGFVKVQDTRQDYYPPTPGTPGTPAIPYAPAVTHEEGADGWNAGARSIASISANGQYKFSVPSSVGGVITGFQDVNIDAGYANIEHALEFASGLVRVMESGVAVTSAVPYSSTDVFAISRVGKAVRYYKNTTQLYYSAKPSTGTIFIDSSLYKSDDSIIDASIATVVDSDFTGDAVELGTFTEQILLPEFVIERINATDKQVQTVGMATEIAAFTEFFLLDESVVERMTATHSHSTGITTYVGNSINPRDPTGAGRSEVMTAKDRHSVPELVVEFQMVRATSFDIINSGQKTSTNGIPDGYAVEVGITRDRLFDAEMLVERATGRDDLSGVGKTNDEVLEVFYADEDVKVERGYLVVESATASEVFSVVGKLSNTVVESGLASNPLLSSPQTLVVNTITATGVLTSAMTAGSDTVENATVTVVTAITAVIANTYSELGIFDTAYQFAFTNNAIDNGTATDANQSEYILGNNDVEHGTATLLHVYGQEQLIAEYGTGSGALQQTSITTQQPPVIEHGFGDVVVQGGGMWGAWTAHLETFAMSRYTGTPYQSMAVVDGVLLGTHEAGVSRLDADDDEGKPIDASIVHDWTDKVLDRTGEMRSSEYVKHPRFLYIGAETAGVLTFTLGYIGRGGNEAFAKYRVLTKNTATATSRAILGRGITSRYLKPTISNENGAQFFINDATLLVDQTIRRT